ncbi:MAG: DNA repair protein RadC [Planctomycetes bacterium]|nr:DNA repair protein RadC [Planctomycetota bacterium]MBI3847732.1 DNA repair protein RadC [Planctomycetota bacterium]
MNDTNDRSARVERRRFFASVRDLPELERPRERLLVAEEDVLTDAEVLGVVLGCGFRGRSAGDIARALLAHSGSLRAIARLTASELRRIAGIGPARAAQLLGAFALARRLATESLVPGAPLRSSADIYRHFAARLRDRKREEFLVVLLDGKNRVMREARISLGSLNASIVHPREVFHLAVRESAGAVVLVHNHPSGDPTPSAEDIEVTQRLARAGDILGIRVLDHVVVGEGSYTSFMERGLLPVA